MCEAEKLEYFECKSLFDEWKERENKLIQVILHELKSSGRSYDLNFFFLEDLFQEILRMIFLRKSEK